MWKPITWKKLFYICSKKNFINGIWFLHHVTSYYIYDFVKVKHLILMLRSDVCSIISLMCQITSWVLDRSELMSFAPQVIAFPSDVINTTPNKCSDWTSVQPSNAAVTPSKSFCAIEIFLFIRLFDALVQQVFLPLVTWLLVHRI